MRFNKINNVLNICRNLLKDYVDKGDVVVDCTVGNGNDTLLLSKLVGPEGKVYGFDIQEIAISNTKNLIENEYPKANVELILDSHEHIDKHVHGNLDLVIYNLGYLPGGNKDIKTSSSTSILSMKKALILLKESGVLLITVYPGHTGGMEEKIAIEKLLSNLNQKEFNVLKYEFINQVNYPPILYMIEKSKTH